MEPRSLLILPEIDQIKIATTYTPDRKRAELSVQETCKSFSETPGGLAQPGMCVGVGFGEGGVGGGGALSPRRAETWF